MFQHSKGYRYYLAVTLPGGSTDISISEISPSLSNYIALKGMQSHAFINGNYRVISAGHTSLEFAGSLWSYKRLSNGRESINTEGKIDEDVALYVLATQVYEGVTFSFNLPNSKMNDIDSPVYLWNTFKWESCDVNCGHGYQERNVTCDMLLPGHTEHVTQDSDTKCSRLTKPILRQECSMELCHYSWVVSEWNQCNASCGDSGIQTRTVKCQQNASVRDGSRDISVGDHFCSEVRPPSTQLCNIRACQYEWAHGEWTVCEAVCGEGATQRQVWCTSSWRGEGRRRVNSTFCHDEHKPKEVTTCQSSAGSCFDYQWNMSDWSEVCALAMSDWSEVCALASAIF